LSEVEIEQYEVLISKGEPNDVGGGAQQQQLGEEILAASATATATAVVIDPSRGRPIAEGTLVSKPEPGKNNSGGVMKAKETCPFPGFNRMFAVALGNPDGHSKHYVAHVEICVYDDGSRSKRKRDSASDEDVDENDPEEEQERQNEDDLSGDDDDDDDDEDSDDEDDDEDSDDEDSEGEEAETVPHGHTMSINEVVGVPLPPPPTAEERSHIAEEFNYEVHAAAAMKVLSKSQKGQAGEAPVAQAKRGPGRPSKKAKGLKQGGQKKRRGADGSGSKSKKKLGRKPVLRPCYSCGEDKPKAKFDAFNWNKTTRQVASRRCLECLKLCATCGKPRPIQGKRGSGTAVAALGCRVTELFWLQVAASVRTKIVTGRCATGAG